MIALSTPKQSRELTTVKVAAVKFENNHERGRRWVEMWLVLGYMDGEAFVQQVHPDTGDEVFAYLKLEDGGHPLDATKALRKCSDASCGKWGTAGICTECGEPTVAYDGCTRFLKLNVGGGGELFEELMAQADAFLVGERVPSLEDWGQEIKLVDGVVA